ncbi:hypothetical protein FB451DRAFT_585886 [Mycena latifolia]|nr:hypothetical protein FB451DRAFT_585886 [Mycena latifolia]
MAAAIRMTSPTLGYHDDRVPSTAGLHTFNSGSGLASRAGLDAQVNCDSNAAHRRNESTDAQPLRLVGRGGQGSRPRNLLVQTDGTPSVPRPHQSPSAEPSAPQRTDSTRIVGRGGIGSRPRGLLTPAPPEPIEPPSLPPSPIQSTKPAEQPILYRPGGRGGAGSRPRKAVPASEASAPSKSLKLPWKSKGKKTPVGSASTYGAPSLTRTDTVGTTTSSIYFTPPRSLGRSQTLYPPLPDANARPETPRSAHSSASSAETVDPRQFRPARLHKLARTLGVEFGPRMAPAASLTMPQDSTKAQKAARRSSVSAFVAYSDPGLVDPIAEKAMRRRSSYEPLPSLQDPNAVESPESCQQQYNPPPTALPSARVHYPVPPRPLPLLPHEIHPDDDAQSDILTYDDASTDDTSDLRTISSSSTASIRFQPYDTEDDDEIDEIWDRFPHADNPERWRSRSLRALPRKREALLRPIRKHSAGCVTYMGRG